MKNDEFGNLPRGGEKRSPNREFGQIQKTEFSHYSEAPKVGKTSLNSTETVNDEINEGKGKTVETEGVSSSKVEEIATKATTVSTAAHAATSVASVVAVATVSTAVAINIVNATDASVTFYRLNGGGNYLEYGLVLRDVKEDDPFSIRLTNNEYDKSYTLNPGENFGMFEGLKEGESYQIIVAQQRLGGAEIYHQTYITNPYAEVYYAEIYDFDFEENTFVVSLSYEDEADRFSNFSLHIAGEAGKDLEFPLEKTLDSQIVSFSQGDLMPGMETTFYIEYSDFASRRKTNKFELFIEEAPVHESYFHAAFVGEFDFSENTFEAWLSYEDPWDNLSDFTLYIANELGQELSYPMEKSLDPQTFSFGERDFYPGLETYFYVTYKNGEEEGSSERYTLTVTDAGQEDVEPTFYGGYIFPFDPSRGYFETQISVDDPYDKITDIYVLLYDENEELVNSYPVEKNDQRQIIYFDEGTFLFGKTYSYQFQYEVDGVYRESEFSTVTTLGEAEHISEITGVEIYDFDLESRTFKLDLYFKDEQSQILNPRIVFEKDDGTVFEFSIELTSETQTIGLYETELYYGDEIQYYVEYELGTNTLQTERFSMTIEEPSGQATIHGVEIFNFDLSSGYIGLALSYDDPENQISNALLVFEKGGQVVASYVIELTDTEQMIEFGEGTFSADTEYEYYIEYEASGVTKQTERSVVTPEAGISETGEIQTAEITDFDLKDNIIGLQITYSDPNNEISEPRLVIEKDSTVVFSGAISLTSDGQTISFDEGTFEYETDYTYYVTYIVAGKQKQTTPTFVATGTAPIEASLNGVNFDFAANYSTMETNVVLDYNDPDEAMSDFQIHFESVSGTYTYNLSKTLDMQTVILEGMPLTGDGMTYRVYVTYSLGGEVNTFEVGEGVIANTATTQGQFNTLIINSTVDEEKNVISVTLDFDDPDDQLHDFSLKLTDGADNSTDTPLSHTTDPQEVPLIGLFALNASNSTVQYVLTYYEVGVDAPYMVEGSIELEFSSSPIDSSSSTNPAPFDNPFPGGGNGYVSAALDGKGSANIRVKNLTKTDYVGYSSQNGRGSK